MELLRGEVRVNNFAGTEVNGLKVTEMIADVGRAPGAALIAVIDGGGVVVGLVAFEDQRWKVKPTDDYMREFQFKWLYGNDAYASVAVFLTSEYPDGPTSIKGYRPVIVESVAKGDGAVVFNGGGLMGAIAIGEADLVSRFDIHPDEIVQGRLLLIRGRRGNDGISLGQADPILDIRLGGIMSNDN